MKTMKQQIIKYLSCAGMVVMVTAQTSCEKDFAEVNTNPNVVTKPDIKFMLSYSEDKLVTYQGTEWVWESMEQLLRFSQHVTSSFYELTNNVNTRYNNYYLQILPNLFEIRRLIDERTDKDSYRKMRALTYIIQVLHGLKVTDMNGFIPYTQAIQGRYDNNYSPVYDSQEALFNTWLEELNGAITTLSEDAANQQTYGTADIFYKGDWTKWVKLANSLKLRIAARLENQNPQKTTEIFQQVMQHPTGIIELADEQLSYQSIDYLPFGNGGDINYRSIRYATTSIMKFMKASNDPRLPIYFEQNDLRGSFRDTLTKYGVSLPSFINNADPLINFQGAPANILDPIFSYTVNALKAGPNNYFLISPINRKFFSPRWNGATSGEFRDVMVTAGESCLLVAEFIQKGYAGSVNTRGTAEDWYKKGVTISIQTMNEIAKAAGSTTGFSGNGTTEINDYLGKNEVKFNGANNLERIYIQQYLNLYRNPNEAFVFVRRTGYPKTGSAYYARETFNEPIPRRFWTNDPGELNRANWQTALQQQGFTPLTQDPAILNKERIWYDQKAPAFGQGN